MLGAQQKCGNLREAVTKIHDARVKLPLDQSSVSWPSRAFGSSTPTAPSGTVRPGDRTLLLLPSCPRPLSAPTNSAPTEVAEPPKRLTWAQDRLIDTYRRGPRDSSHRAKEFFRPLPAVHYRRNDSLIRRCTST